MALVSDLNTVPLSGYTHIDALLDQGPDWNYITPYSNTILYTFSVASGNESDVRGQVSFSASQRTHTVEALRYLGQMTGINFVETTDGNAAQVHFANVDITHSAQTIGLCSWRTSYRYTGNTVTRYEVDAYVYLDNREFAYQTSNLTPGTDGYETLLHELGHALGLKHPFETTTGNNVTLPSWQDNSSNTLMSYHSYGGPYAQMSQYDVAALMWLYGGDGLGGELGADAAGRFLVGTQGADSLTGTSGDDVLVGVAGNDVINGGAGNDTAEFTNVRSAYVVTASDSGIVVRDASNSFGNDGTDKLVNVERLQFSDAALALDIDGNGGQAYRIYNSVLNRTPDEAGLGFWIDGMDEGMSLRQVASHFITSNEFRANFGENLSNSQLVSTLYQNILDRAPEQAGVDYWVGALDAGKITQAEALAMISESAENRASVDPVISNGFVYDPWA